ncbi:MAG: LETM1 domain-containing protein [Deltaproteobacteria bacterium]|nr:LETM1 domain-containing protein [Deltaproteobacteria bacterium]
MSVPRRWLAQLLAESFASTSLPSHNSGAAPLFRSVTRARRLALAMGGARGLMFGAPQLRRRQALSRDVEELFPIIRMLAVVADVVSLAGDLVGGNKRAAFAGACAVVYGDVDAVDDARLLVTGIGAPNKHERALLAVEKEIGRRRYLTGNPILGLMLHHAFTAIDARGLILVAVDILDGCVPDRELIDRVQRRLAKERLAVASAISGLSEWRELVAADIVRSASLWQVKNLGLSKEQTVRLLEVVKQPPDLSRLLTVVPVEARARVFVHAVLAAVVDGRVSAEERRFVTSLGNVVGLSPAAQRRGRMRVMDFVKRHPEDFNPLAAAAGFAAVDPPIAVRVARTLFENVDALWREVRETGDLGVLLARRAAGQTLTDDEQRRMRDQLLDVVKAVPSLAVIALPGGFVLLPLLLKLLPFDLRPSSFRDLDDFHAFAKDDADTLSPKEHREREDTALQAPRFWRRSN